MIIQAELHSQKMVLINLALANLCFENPLDMANTQHMQHHKQHQHHYDSLTETSKESIHKPHSRPSKWQTSANSFWPKLDKGFS